MTPHTTALRDATCVVCGKPFHADGTDNDICISCWSHPGDACGGCGLARSDHFYQGGAGGCPGFREPAK